MAETRRIDELLEHMLRSFSEFIAVLVVDRSGLLINARYRASLDKNLIFDLGACIAKIYGEVSALSCNDHGCNVERILIQCRERHLVIVKVGEAAVLGLLVTPKANLGMVFIEAQRYANQLAGIL